MPVSLESMVSSGALAQPKDDPVFKSVPKGDSFRSLVGELEKMGARHGKKDQTAVQTIHDAAAGLVDCVHCCEMAEKGVSAADLEKAGKRHSEKDLGRIAKVHALSVELGAMCKGTSMSAKDGEDNEDE